MSRITVSRSHSFRWAAMALGLALYLSLLTMPAFSQHIHELYYNNVSWADTDLTSITGGPVVYPQGVAAFYTTPNDQFHVYYASNVGLDFHLHQLYYNGSSWSDADLTALTGGAAVSNSSGLSGFSIGNAQYVYFCASDFSVHEYSYGDGGNFNWVDRNLTALTASGFAGTCGFAPAGISASLTANGQRHVYFAAPSGTSNTARILRQYYFNGTKWLKQGLTGLTKGAKAEAATWISAIAIGNSQYLYFEAPNGHIHEYSFVTAWKDTDLTVTAAGVVAGTFEGNGASAFTIPGTTKRLVYYAASGTQNVHQVQFAAGVWTDTDLSALTGGRGPISLTQMTGFATTPNNQLHLYFFGIGDSDIDQLYYNGSAWAEQELPSAAVANIGPGMAGFALGNLQRVYYISAN